MIRSEAVGEVPLVVVETLRPFSRVEYDVATSLQFTGLMWVIYEDDVPLMFLHVDKLGLLGYGELQVLICEGFRPRHFRGARQYARALAEKFHGLVTTVRCDFEVGKKFAEFLGFRATGLTSVGFTVFEMRA